MSNVIEIKFSEALPTSSQNKLRYRMELAAWRASWRKAEAEKDYRKMDELEHEFGRVGLP